MPTIHTPYILLYVRTCTCTPYSTHADAQQVVDDIVQDYEIPKYFRDDLFKLVSESRRPPYRWFLIGK